MTLAKSRLSLFLALLFLAFVGSAGAMPRLGVDRQGVILSVDLDAQQMIMRRVDTSEILSFTWNRRTVFIADSTITGPSLIKPR